MRFRMTLYLTLLLVVALGACERASPEPVERTKNKPNAPLVVAGTSMIECAVRELMGDAVRVHRLAPPGQCPGHFDLKPADFEAIAAADVLLRHDYQSHYDGKLRTNGSVHRIVELPTTGPQTIPDHYVELCQALAQRLAEVYPTRAGSIRRRLARITEAERELASGMLRAAAPLKGTPVIASELQAAFCEWVGLRVVGRFDRKDEMSLKQLASLVETGRAERVVGVVGNLQRGEREGRVIATRLGAPLVLLSNFPLRPDHPAAHRALVRQNVKKLLEACGE